ncbi:hypothetical protein J2847_004101 [Azospirillum agricola]|uniref:hypothetical protein n=1 Tax=Azospirillum agricola TaxID=1720247 RepID=UPI001AE1FE6F|nr:hypothetical protein [Azospirillum agricola]MBP2230792.1 hypothetical protein [Azospirillum agricola]
MEGYYFSTNIDNDRVLCLSPLSNRKIELSGQELADTSGYFLYEQRGSDELQSIEIIAHVLTDDGVWKLREAFGME